MFANKKYIFIVTPFFLITLFSFPHLWAQEKLKKDQQKSENKQKQPPKFTIKGTKLTVAPEKQKAEGQQKQVPAQGHPKISFDATKHNAGEVWEGAVVSHTFIVKNTGTAQLDISKVKPG